MRCLVISGIGYPSDAHPYRGGFIHSRIMAYAERGVECRVFTTNRGAEGADYVHDGIPVAVGDFERCVDIVVTEKPDRILVHFLSTFSTRILRRFPEIPAIIWVHGFEATSWRRRLANISFQFPIKAMKNTIRRIALHRFITRGPSRSDTYIFVSSWIHNAAQRDIRCTINNYALIPNPIDPVAFPYRQKDGNMAKYVLVLRSFSSKTYATDVAMQAIGYVLDQGNPATIHFTVIGEGKLYKKHTRKIRDRENVILMNRMLRHEEMSEVFSRHGVILIPTRRDTQNVTMCEAMMSGLVPVTSPVDAIPEFVEQGTSGLMGRTARDLARHLLALAADGREFQRLSAGAHAAMMRKAAAADVTDRELAIIASNGPNAGKRP